MKLTIQANSTHRLLALFAIVGATAVSASPSHAQWNDLSRTGLRVLSPLGGAWIEAGTLQFSGEADSNWQVSTQVFSDNDWYDIYGDTLDVTYDGFPDNPGRTDESGLAWFNWHVDLYSNNYTDPGAWGAVVTRDDGQRGLPIEFRFVNKNTAGNVPLPYSHFGADGPQCLADHAADDLLTVTNECALGKGSVTLNWMCGHESQLCCAGADQPCDDGLTCSNFTCLSSSPPPPPAPPPPAPPPAPPPPATNPDIDGDGCEIAGSEAPVPTSANYCNSAGASINHNISAFETGVNPGIQVNITLICAGQPPINVSDVGQGNYINSCAQPLKSYCGFSPACATRKN
jgi:hypothetical protein